MAKKATRKIPVMKLTIVGDGTPDAQALCDNVVFANAVYTETVESIKDAIKTKSNTAILFEIGVSEYYVEIDKNQWKQALQSCLDKLIELEKYEECSEIKLLMDKI